MAGKSAAALPRGNPSPREVKAFAEGRTAAYNEALANTNPHVAGTPAYLAWARGWQTRQSSGTERPDGCCYPAKFTDPTFVATVDATDVSNRTWDFAIDPVLPGQVDFGDGSRGELDASGEISHTYEAESKTHTATCVVMAGVSILEDVVVDFQELALDAYTISIEELVADTVVATVTQDGAVVEDTEVTAVSGDTDVVTVDPATDQTDVSGEVTITLTGVAPGIADVTFTFVATGETRVCAVTITAA